MQRLSHKGVHYERSGSARQPVKIKKNEMPVRKTIEQFIENANVIHSNYYDYSQSIYVNSKVKVNIICPKTRII